MAAPDFPANPTVGQVYTAPSGNVYTWDGAVWTTTSSPQYAYWTDSGTALTPTVATRRLIVPGPTANPATGGQTQVVVGARAGGSRMRLQSLPGINWDGITSNGAYDGTNWASDDSTRASWSLVMAPATDTTGNFTVQYRAPNAAASAYSIPLSIDNAGNCTIAGKYFPAGLAIRNAATAAVPNNFNSNNVLNTWLSVASVNITTAGGTVCIFAMPAWYYAGSGGVICYVGIFRGGTQLLSVKVNISTGASAIQTMGLPTLAYVDSPGPAAGAQSYSCRCYVTSTSANILVGADNNGFIQALELS